MKQVRVAMVGAGVVGLTLFGGVMPANAAVEGREPVAAAASQSADIPLTVTSPSAGETIGVRPTVTGTGIPGANVQVGYSGAQGSPSAWGTVVTVRSDGTWSYTFESDIPAGPVSLYVVGHSMVGGNLVSTDFNPAVIVSTDIAGSPMFASPVAAGAVATVAGLGGVGLFMRRRRSADAVEHA